MQKYNQVTGGNCRLVLLPESAQGVIDTSKAGVVLNFMSESFSAPPNKQPSTVINGKRGAGKPYAGTPNYTGGVQMAPYAPLMGYMLRALCGAPTTTAELEIQLEAVPVMDMTRGYVGLPVSSHSFVQDSTITVTGTDNYNGVYRIEYGTTDTLLVVKKRFVDETLTATAKAHRGRAAFLKGKVKDFGNGTVGLPVSGAGVALNAGESVTVSGSVDYDDTYVLLPGTTQSMLVVSATHKPLAPDLDGTAVALPAFYKHVFLLPKKQPTFAVEKYLDFDAAASEASYRTFLSNKVNGMSFDFGGDGELSINIETAVGSEEATAVSMHPLPAVELPSVPFYNKETAVWIGTERVGDVQNGSISLAYGIEATAAVGDMGKRSRMPEGDPTSTCTLTVFLEEDFYQSLSDSSSTVRFRLSMSGANGEEFWIEFPESELGTGGAQITGKAGLTQEVTVTGFTDQSPTVNIFTMINRVASYA